MRFLETLTVACLLATNTPVLAHPQPASDISISTQRREAAREAERLFAPVSDLWKRKGGGGGGGKGGGGSSSSSGKGGSSGSSSSSSTGYVPAFIQGDGRVRSKGDERVRVADGVGSSTSTLSSREHHRADAGHAVEDSSKPTAGEVKDVSFRPRRFGTGFAAGRISGFSSGKSANSVKMGPTSGHRLPLDGKNKGNDKKIEANRLRSGSTGRGSSGSNAGGQTKTGSGVTPAFGGKYGGGAKTPYTAGRSSPLGIAPVFLGVGLLSIYPGLWLYGAYGYGYHNPYYFHNRTARRNSTDTNTTNTPTRDFPELVIRQDDSGVNESKPVTCLCAQYSVCGCDDDGNYTFLDTIIGDGDYFKLNHTLVTVADVNGTSTILLNGTLPNGTTAAGGTEDAITSDGTNVAVRSIVEAGGYWVMIATVGLTCFVI